MLNISLIREDPAAVKKNLEKRRNPEYIKWLDDLVKKDAVWRALKQESDKIRARRNEITREIKEAKNQGKDAKKLLTEAKQLPGKIKENDAKAVKLQQAINSYLMRLPNLLHDSVPFGKDDSENTVAKEVGKKTKRSFEIKHHGQLAAELDLADFERAVKVSGTGF